MHRSAKGNTRLPCTFLTWLRRGSRHLSFAKKLNSALIQLTNLFFSMSAQGKRKTKSKGVKKRSRTQLASRRLLPVLPTAPTGWPSGYGMSRSGEEKKYHDIGSPTLFSQVFTGSTGNVLLLNGVADGSGVTTRVGNKITIKSISIRGLIYPTWATDGVPPTTWTIPMQLCRISVVYDAFPNSVATVPTADIIYTTNHSYSHNNLANRNRFRTLWEKTIGLPGMVNYNVANGGTGLVGGNTAVPVKKFIRTNIETIYSGPGNTIANIGQGAIYLVVTGSAAALTPGVGPHYFNGDSRIRYSDA